MKGRDERGRFLPGNRESVGNKGNRRPKWGNQNARVHGLYSRAWFNVFEVDPDGWLRITYLHGKPVNLRIHPDTYFTDENGVYFRDDIIQEIERRILENGGKTGLMSNH